MATLLERHGLLTNNDFTARVKLAVLNAASDILADPTQEDIHEFAGHIILEPNNAYFQSMFAYQVVANPAINEASVDGDIQFTVNSQFAKLGQQYMTQRVPPARRSEVQGLLAEVSTVQASLGTLNAKVDTAVLDIENNKGEIAIIKGQP